METGLAQAALSMGKRDSPPGKKLLKEAAGAILPGWVIDRSKETFQGGAGISQAIAAKIPNPIRYYNAEARNIFGYLPTA